MDGPLAGGGGKRGKLKLSYLDLRRYATTSKGHPRAGARRRGRGEALTRGTAARLSLLLESMPIGVP